MPIVVKEASNTPLAVAALAKSMADTYSNYAANEREYAKWEQESTWRNEDRELGRQSADALAALGGDAFLGGEAGMYGAMSAARNNENYSNYLLTPPDPTDTPEYKSKISDLAGAYSRRYPQMTPQQAMDAATHSILNSNKTSNDPMGFNTRTIDPALGAVGIDPVQSSTNSSGETTFNFGSPDVTLKSGQVLPGYEIDRAAMQRNMTPEQVIEELRKKGHI